MKKSFFCLFVFIILGMSGCSIIEEIASTSENLSANENSSQHDQIIMLTKRLASQLYLNIKPSKQSANIAVGTFTDLTTLQGTQESLPLQTLGLQLEDGLMTESVQRGFKVIDYRLRKNLTITKDGNFMLSRELKFIDEHQNINYFLTGTIAVTDENILVNARLVSVKSKTIVAAATSVLTTNELGQPNNISLRSGKIYRSSKNPNRGSK